MLMAITSDTWFILGGGLVLLLLVVILSRTEALRTRLPTWLAAGLLGLFVGAGGMYLALDYQYRRPLPASERIGGAAGAVGPATKKAGPAGTAGGGGAGFAGPGGSGPAPASRSDLPAPRKLVRLVGKIARLERGLKLELDSAQAKKLQELLGGVEQAEKTDMESATQLTEELLGLLTDDQKKLLDQIELPGDFEGPALRSGGGAGMPGMPQVAEDEMGMVFMRDFNPFRTERNRRWLAELRERLAARGD